MILGIQMIGLIFALLMLYITFIHFKKRDFTIKETILWMGLWLSFIVVTLFPAIIDPLVSSLQISRKLDFFVILGILFMITAVYHTYTVVRANQRKIEQVVRAIAIEKVQKK